MIHLKLFETQAEFDAAKANLIKPWVSLTKENNHINLSSSISVPDASTEANILMVSRDEYQLFGEDLGNGQITYYKFEYVGTREYNGKEYYEYSFMGAMSILVPTRNITKVTFPFEDCYLMKDGNIYDVKNINYNFYGLYGFTEEPVNKVIMQHRTNIGTNANGHDYVDLGLTSGTLWATMNVGAESPTEYGKYFQWGDTIGYYLNEEHDFSWDTYKYGDGQDFSKYSTEIHGYGGTIDNKLELDLSDDGVRVNMGGDWRMPSYAQIKELINETNHEWIEDYQGTGINGRLLTSKFNGNSIFIPASGYRCAYLVGDGSDIALQSYNVLLWSSSLDAYSPIKPLMLSLVPDGSFDSNGRYRCYGACLRGVL